MEDPQKALAGVEGAYPGVEIDTARTGDHLDKFDTKIRMIKEMMRSIILQAYLIHCQMQESRT